MSDRFSISCAHGAVRGLRTGYSHHLLLGHPRSPSHYCEFSVAAESTLRFPTYVARQWNQHLLDHECVRRKSGGLSVSLIRSGVKRGLQFHPGRGICSVEGWPLLFHVLSTGQ
jgi:hypothetical protein